MELDQGRLVAVVNLLTDSFYPNPDDPGPAGPWGPWIREAMRELPFPQSSNRKGPLPDPWRAAFAALAGLSGHVDDRDAPWRRPRPNWIAEAFLDLASLNPQPLPPVDLGIQFARSLADVAMRRAQEAGGDQGGRFLQRFADDWCGTVIRLPIPPKPGDPGEPRPPRPQESLVLGAALIRAASTSEDATLKEAAEGAGHKIFENGLSGLG